MLKSHRFAVIGFLVILFSGLNSTLAQPLSGTKTIGGTTPDYPTITSAIAAVRTVGVASTGVHFVIRNGSYYESSDSLTAHPTLRGPVSFTVDTNANVHIYKTGNVNSYSAAIQVINITRVTFDGSWFGDTMHPHMFIHVGANNSFLLWFSENTDSCIVRYCAVGDTTPQFWGTPLLIDPVLGSFPSPNYQRRIKVLHNWINGTLEMAWGASGVNNFDYAVIDSNRVSGTICVGYCYGASLLHNTMHAIVWQGNSGAISANCVAAEIAIYGDNNQVYNNMVGHTIQNGGDSEIVYDGSGNKYYFNTAANLFDSAAAFTSFNNSSLEIVGNIFAKADSTAGEGQYLLKFIDTTHYPVCNYNVYWMPIASVNDSCYFARIGTRVFKTLDQLQQWRTWAPRDTFSQYQNQMPMFVNPYNSNWDLHLRTNVPTVCESAAQLPTPNWVTTDFDGEPRSNPTDVGADAGNFRTPEYGWITGTARDLTYNVPVRNALVHANLDTTRTDSLGHYSFFLRDGGYHIWTPPLDSCYTSAEQFNVDIDSTETHAGVNLNPARPVFHPLGDTLEISVPFNQSVTRTIQFINDGAAPLFWTARPWLNLLDTAHLPIANPSPPPLPATDRTWGYDHYGNYAYDSNEPTWPAQLAFRDLHAIGTVRIAVSNAIGNVMYNMNLPESFRFCGTEMSRINLNSCGFVRFNDSTAVPFTPQALLVPGITNAIFPYWCRAVIDTVRTFYDATQHIFYTQWDGDEGTTTNPFSFQLQLHCVQNQIVMMYHQIPTAVNYMTITGIQHLVAGDSSFLQLYDRNYVDATAPTLFTSGYGIVVCDSHSGGGDFPRWLTVSPMSGAISAHWGEATISLTANLGPMYTEGQRAVGAIRIEHNSCPFQTIFPVAVTVQSEGVSTAQTELPNRFRLYPNYPNPFNPVTEIRFSLPLASETKMVVYNMQGRAVSELVNRMLPGGIHAVRFDGTKLASGIYFVRLNAGRLSAERKVVLLK